jgi:hypothetical protein
MTVAGVGKKWDWRQNIEIKRPIPRRGRNDPDHRGIVIKSGALASHIDASLKMLDSRFYGEFTSQIAELIQLGPWKFHGDDRAKSQILTESRNYKCKNGGQLIMLEERRENRKTARDRINFRKPRNDSVCVIDSRRMGAIFLLC